MLLETDTYDKRHSCNVKSESGRRWKLKPTHTSIIVWHIIALVYYFSTTVPNCNAESTTGKVRILDLSHTFDENTVYWVTAKKLDLTITHNGTDPSNTYWYQSDEIAAGTHGGTHMDSPCHFAMGRWCIADIPLEHLVVPAVVVDISNYVADNPNNHLSLGHMTEWERDHGQIPDKSLLLIRTGWSKFWPDPLSYTGTTERKAELLKFPSIKPEVAKWLVENRNIVGIGIDVMSIDMPVSTEDNRKGVHRTLMDKNIYGLENVYMPEPLPATGAKAYVMPMKLKDASGAPCRIFLEVSEGMTSGNVGSNSMSHLWTVLIIVIWIVKNIRH